MAPTVETLIAGNGTRRYRFLTGGQWRIGVRARGDRTTTVGIIRNSSGGKNKRPTIQSGLPFPGGGRNCLAPQNLRRDTSFMPEWPLPNLGNP
ncbi:MAG: hypothetical protein OEY63_06230 [Gemmatimonadota bacterium]|nr:hypothetical protein [Gemmatimonadota bacterium]